MSTLQSDAAQETSEIYLVICSYGAIAQGVEISPETVVYACTNENGLHDRCDLQKYAWSAAFPSTIAQSYSRWQLPVAHHPVQALPRKVDDFHIRTLLVKVEITIHVKDTTATTPPRSSGVLR